MPNVFARILDGTAYADFVWQDEVCVAFMDIRPKTDGHVLIVPRAPVDHWLDADDATRARLWEVTAKVGRAQQAVFPCNRIGVIIAGYEVPQLHIHSFPTDSMADFDLRFHTGDRSRGQLALNAKLLRDELGRSGSG